MYETKWVLCEAKCLSAVEYTKQLQWVVCVVRNTTVATRIQNEPHWFSKRSFSRAQRTRATLCSASRRSQSTSAAVAPPVQGYSPLPQLSDIESFVVDVENPTHLTDWLRCFEISLLCAAPKISEKEKTTVLATKLSSDAFAEFHRCYLPKDVTDYSYEEQWQGSVFSSVSNAPYLPTVTTACVLLGTKGKSSCT
jgi:hypothetical protein